MQEIFQDAAQNAYRTFGRSPMAFLDRQHYCAETGLYPALQRQAERLGFADLLSVSDEPEPILDRFPAVSARPNMDAAPEMLVRRMRNMRLTVPSGAPRRLPLPRIPGGAAVSEVRFNPGAVPQR